MRKWESSEAQPRASQELRTAGKPGKGLHLLAGDIQGPRGQGTPQIEGQGCGAAAEQNHEERKMGRIT
jgi:hypothetical protein